MSLTLYPAIDVRDGRVVRLRQGDYAQETRYCDDPHAVAMRYAQAGATWLHLVDLDAARAGGYTLAPLLERIRATSTLRVQTGGGVRNDADIDAILAAGADRVVVGSLAVRDPKRVAGWLRQFGADRVTVALDARQDEGGQWQLPTEGWTQASGVAFDSLLRSYVESGLRHLLSTDIARDGMLAGPNLGLYRQILSIAPGIDVQASGGVRDAGDVAAVREAGCGGVVLGKALLEGHIDLAALCTEPTPC